MSMQPLRTSPFRLLPTALLTAALVTATFASAQNLDTFPPKAPMDDQFSRSELLLLEVESGVMVATNGQYQF